MSSNNRALLAALSILAVLPLAGCQIDKPVPPPEAVNQTPIKLDDAMVARQWGLSPVKYSNDHVTAGPTLFLLSTKPEPQLGNTSETALFLANIAIMPYEIFDVPAWKQLEFKAMVMNPTYTGNPPLPTSPVPPVQ